MNYLFTFCVLTFTIIGKISCDCGCLKCSKHLQVVSPPYFPYQIIAPQPSVPNYIPIPAGGIYDYGNYGNYGPHAHCPVYAYKYQAQAPVPPPPPPPKITGLLAKPDRLVLQRTCPTYIDDGDCSDEYNFRPACNSIFHDGYYGASLPSKPVVPTPGPILEPLTHDIYSKFSCDCRYDHAKSRKKRELPLLNKSIHFIMGLLPHFLRFPIEQTLKSFKYHQKKPIAPKMKPFETFLYKLQKLNRAKRSLVFAGDEINLPFLRVTDVENNLEDEENESSEEDKYSKREEFLQPLNFNHLVPHSPIYYLLNAPIRFLHHIHKLGQQISPVFKSVPHVFINSKKYLRNFGKNLKNEVLNFASNIIGDFEDVDTHRYRRPTRYKRSLEQYQPEYSLVFGNQTEHNNRRRKRYILKVVDEDEVEQFLREKLGPFAETPERPKKKKEKDTTRKKLVVEKLASKLIIDNNGRPFIEINGVKRPLFRNKKLHEESNEPQKETDDDTTEDMKEKINSIITQARARIGQAPQQQTVPIPNQIIKERINQILIEIQDLINLDFDRYSTIHSDLCKLDNFKHLLVNEWKKILIENKSNDISSKIRLLDDFREMQILRDKSVEDIACALSSGSSFMTKKLIKMLVRLQKLQCIIYRVVEDFGEKIKMGTEFDVRKEIKYVEYLNNLHFIVGRTQHDLESDLKRERDLVLENEMMILDGLRKLEENENCPKRLYEEAQLLWEIKNIDKLQKDTILELNAKISRGQKVRKELKILFDLLRQQESCEEKQKNLLYKEKQEEIKIEEDEEDESKEIVRKSHKRNKIFRDTSVTRNRNFPFKTIIEDKKPIRLVSNGYSMTAYKVSDGFD